MNKTADKDAVLKRQRDFAADFDTWFRAGLYDTLEDNRRRYRMQLVDEDERKAHGLSCLSSTKSTAAVDRAVEKAVQEYHGDPDALGYVAKQGADQTLDQKVNWLSEIFKIRCKDTFPFELWHVR
jgi:hypothetical protein